MRVDKKTVDSFLPVLENFKHKKAGRVALLTFSELKQSLNKSQKQFVNELLKLNPAHYGFKGENFGINEVPVNLVCIKNQKYTWRDKEKQIAGQYLPKKVFTAYSNLNRALQKSLNRKLLIKSGYRSPAYQLLTFIYWLKQNNYNLEKTLKKAALPGYSEHNNPSRQAVDFITETGIIHGPEVSFDETAEYKWLLKHASKYNFYLSYPKNNKKGVIFEPWHWHYEN